MSTDRWMDKEDVVNTCHAILLSRKKAPWHCSNVDGHGDDRTKQGNQPETTVTWCHLHVES